MKTCYHPPVHIDILVENMPNRSEFSYIRNQVVNCRGINYYSSHQIIIPIALFEYLLVEAP